MKKTYHLALLLVSITTALFTNCDKKDDAEIKDIAIIGRVQIYDEYGNVEKDLSGIKIKATNIESEETVVYDTVTDNQGRYRLTEPEPGTYTFIFEKHELQHIEQEFIFTGSVLDSLNLIQLFKSPSNTTNVSINKAWADSIIMQNEDTSQVLEIEITMNHQAYTASSTAWNRYFISNEPTVSKTNYLLSFSQGVEMQEATKTIKIHRVLKTELTNSGDTLYITAYPCNPASTGYIADSTNNTFPGLGIQSNIQLFTPLNVSNQ